MYLAVSIVVAILAGWLAHGLARSKRRNAWGWAAASAILIVPVLVLAVLPPLPGGTDRLPPAAGQSS
jgi:hypothetical protein